MNHIMSSRRSSELTALSHLEGLLYTSLRLTKYGQQAVRLTHEAIVRLPVEFRIVFVLSYLEGFSHEEIAELSGAKTEAVVSMLSRGLELIQKKDAKYAQNSKGSRVTLEEVPKTGTDENWINSAPVNSHSCGQTACCRRHSTPPKIAHTSSS